jgi:hypothetical protein
MMEHAAPQKRRASKTRGRKKAEWEMDFFCIGLEGLGLEAPVICDTQRRVKHFHVVFGFFWSCSGSRVGCERMNQTGDTPASTVVAPVKDYGYNKTACNFLIVYLFQLT